MLVYELKIKFIKENVSYRKEFDAPKKRQDAKDEILENGHEIIDSINKITKWYPPTSIIEVEMRNFERT